MVDQSRAHRFRISVDIHGYLARVDIHSYPRISRLVALEKVLVSMTPEMKEALEAEAKRRKLPSIQELIRQILADHLRRT
jgi:hypothetical protein